MFCASIVIVAVLACAEGGYENSLPGVPFHLANRQTSTHHQRIVQNHHQQTFDGTAQSNGYNFLQPHSDGQESVNGYQRGQIYGTVSNGQTYLNGYRTGQNHVTVSNTQESLNGYQSGHNHVTVSNAQGSLNSYQSGQNHVAVSNGQGSLSGYQTGQNHVTVSNGQGSPNIYQSGQNHGTVSNGQGTLNGYQQGKSHGTVVNGQGSLNGYQTSQNQGAVSNFGNQQNGNSGQGSGLISPASAHPVQAIVTKHIYFHVAPPDAEEKRTTQVNSNRKKTYNIVFIKVPSQQSRYAGNSQLLQNQYAVSETKTLIYVLVKKPENLVNKQATPNHEVFYVKYKGSPDRAVSQLSSDISQTNTLHSLQPGLINGQS